MKKRTHKGSRKTSETNIKWEISLDGSGKSKINTGIAFLDHMLTLFAKHGLFDLKIDAKGDLEVDIHHTNEDIGLCLGEAVKQALGDKKGIKRFATVFVPMDEALARVVMDISGRPSLTFNQTGGHVHDKEESKEEYTLIDAKHFLYSFCNRSGINMHIDIKYGEDLHHMLEATFKAFGKALDEATQIDPRVKGIPSTKGKL
ncbi:MAG: imidazoleglycerol-phosphate dehydratase HisB [bacterium]